MAHRFPNAKLSACGLIVAFSAIAFGHSIERAEKLTIVKFSAADFGSSAGRIEEDLGWRLGCLLQTKEFHFPEGSNSEVEIIVDISAEWENTVNDPDGLSQLHLAVFELTYHDQFGNEEFIPLTLQPLHFGPMIFVAQASDGQQFFYGGSMSEKKLISFGPMVVPHGSRDAKVSICDIAPVTNIQIHELQIRFRAVD